MTEKPRRGWRETSEPGIYRAHRVACPSTVDHRPGRRCDCPWQVAVPSPTSGSRLVTVEGSITDARATRRHLLAHGKPAREDTSPRDTLNEFAASYFRAKASVLAINTIRNRDDDYRRRIAPALGELLLEDLTRERVEVWLAALVESGASPRAVTQTIATLRVILGTAVEWGRLVANPASRIRPPRVNKEAGDPLGRVLSAGELRRLFAAAKSARVETMLRTAGEAGLRRSEVIGLKWPDVDLAARRLTVRRSVVQERATKDRPMRKVETLPKGGREAQVAITAALAERLGDWYAKSVVEGGADATGFVWPGRDRGPMHDRSPNQVLERTCGYAGLVDAEDKPLVTFHGLRHSSAGVMFAHGVPLIVISRQLRHRSTHITATIYQRWVRDTDLDLASAVFDTDQRGVSGEGACTVTLNMVPGLSGGRSPGGRASVPGIEAE